MADCSLSELYERIGRNIAYLRKSRKLTQQEFANKLHIHSQSLVSQYENAKKSLTFEKVVDFCVFSMSILKICYFKTFRIKKKIILSNKLLSERHMLQVLYKSVRDEHIMPTILKNKTKTAASFQVVLLPLQ